jgi:hypothetical protein
MTAQKLPTDSQTRKDTPVHSGCLAYFPLALAAVARLSKAGNDKHNPGQPLHWSREKSSDHADCAARHLLEVGVVDPDDGFSHSVKLAWRALALLQLEEEARMAVAALTAAARSRLVAGFDPQAPKPTSRFRAMYEGCQSVNYGLVDSFPSRQAALDAIEQYGSKASPHLYTVVEVPS